MKTKEYIIEFIQKQKVAFIASVDEQGYPNMKAMFTPRKIEENSFYFSTNTSSMRAQQFMKNPKASVYFYNKGRFKYEGIMLTGTMEKTYRKLREIFVENFLKLSLPFLSSLVYDST